MGLNCVNVQGRLVKDPELRATASGKEITEFSIAVNDGKGVDYIPIVAWGSNAVNICKFLKKGLELIVHGKLQNDRWTDKDGKKQSKIKVLCGKPWFTAQSKQQNNTANTQSNNQYGSEPPIDWSNTYSPDSNDDDGIPF